MKNSKSGDIRVGDYTFEIEIGHATLQKDFVIRENALGAVINEFG